MVGVTNSTFHSKKVNSMLESTNMVAAHRIIGDQLKI
jgi:hypothetical protein